jgi:predicted nuclease with TOPRIM domain
MVDIQEIFNRITETKKKQKDIKKLYQDALKNSLEYQEVVDKIKSLQVKKKQIETSTKEQFSSEFVQLDAFKSDLESDNTLLSDAALSLILKGERVEVQDEHKNTYDPVFMVKFKKTS